VPRQANKTQKVEQQEGGVNNYESSSERPYTVKIVRDVVKERLRQILDGRAV
jgi:hypothetical protein